MMKIDVFCHILPPKYLAGRNKRAESKFSSLVYSELWARFAGLVDLNIRFRIMDKYRDYVQILTIAGPNVESITEPKDSVELARIANDEMAELVLKYPDRFVGAVACLPMNDVDAALKEADRAINELRFKGVEIFTNIRGKPVDSPEFWPLYEKMQEYNLPVFLHPRRDEGTADYPGETESKYFIWSVFGWPYETSAAMTRLIFGGVFEKYPNLKVVTHHAGGMVPFFVKRIQYEHDDLDFLFRRQQKPYLTKRPLDYYRMFYNDTAIYGLKSGLMCAYDFFGADHLLFATDFPYDTQLGDRVLRETIESVDQMEISEVEKKKIYEGNARKLLRLPI
jgi:predicted TIM-barrel fold metal-dependent hydrolase